jgi:hypothetical protein
MARMIDESLYTPTHLFGISAPATNDSFAILNVPCVFWSLALTTTL